MKKGCKLIDLNISLIYPQPIPPTVSHWHHLKDQKNMSRHSAFVVHVFIIITMNLKCVAHTCYSENILGMCVINPYILKLFYNLMCTVSFIS